MAVMEFLGQNLLNTTTQLTMQASNTSNSDYLYNRNVNLGWSTDGYNSTTAAVISITFGAPTVITHVLIQNHNLRDFRVYYNSVTANSIVALTTNSATSTYANIASITVNSVDIQMNNTITGSAEKVMGEFIVAERRLVFERNPSHTDWKPSIHRKQIIHDMPDGGVKVFNIRDKFQANLSWDYLSDTFTSSLETEFNRAFPLYFVPFPTTTAWDPRAYETNWIGDFDFKHSENSKTQGRSGSIKLRQTSGG